MVWFGLFQLFASLTWADNLGGGQKRLRYIFWPYLHNGSSDLYEIWNHQPNFHKDPCKDARAWGENTRTCDALQKFRNESTKIKKMRFSAIFE